MDQIRERLAGEPRLAFTSLFEQDMIKSQLVGIFLAILELIRHHQVLVEQENLFDEIWIVALPPGDRPGLHVAEGTNQTDSNGPDTKSTATSAVRD